MKCSWLNIPRDLWPYLFFGLNFGFGISAFVIFYECNNTSAPEHVSQTEQLPAKPVVSQPLVSPSSSTTNPILLKQDRPFYRRTEYAIWISVDPKSNRAEISVKREGRLLYYAGNLPYAMPEINYKNRWDSLEELFREVMTRPGMQLDFRPWLNGKSYSVGISEDSYDEHDSLKVTAIEVKITPDGMEHRIKSLHIIAPTTSNHTGQQYPKTLQKKRIRGLSPSRTPIGFSYRFLMISIKRKEPHELHRH